MWKKLIKQEEENINGISLKIIESIDTSYSV